MQVAKDLVNFGNFNLFKYKGSQPFPGKPIFLRSFFGIIGEIGLNQILANLGKGVNFGGPKTQVFFPGNREKTRENLRKNYTTVKVFGMEWKG